MAMVNHSIDDVTVDNINKFSLFKRERKHIKPFLLWRRQKDHTNRYVFYVKVWY